MGIFKDWKSLVYYPFGWNNIAVKVGYVADMGSGDGDFVQRLIEFCIGYWEKNKLSPVKIHIVGIDLNFSRVKCKKISSYK